MKAKQTTKHVRKTKVATDRPSDAKGKGKSNYAPSVPISVYRELAKELEIAKRYVSAITAQNATLTAQNKTLRQQNQSLRQEAAQVITSAAALQQVMQSTGRSNPPAQTPNAASDVAETQVSPAAAQAASLSSAEQKTESPTSQAITEDLIAQLDRSLAAEIGVSSPTTTTAESIAGADPAKTVEGPFCDVKDGSEREENTAVQPEELVERLVIEQPISAPSPAALATEEEKAKSVNGIWLTLTILVVVVTAFTAGFLVVLPFIQPSSDSAQ